LQLLIVSAHIEKTIRTFVGYPVLDLFFRKLLETILELSGRPLSPGYVGMRDSFRLVTIEGKHYFIAPTGYRYSSVSDAIGPMKGSPPETPEEDA
jgi:hypothetical protein